MRNGKLLLLTIPPHPSLSLVAGERMKERGACFSAAVMLHLRDSIDSCFAVLNKDRE
jgi:hypothetical protein